MTRHAHVLLTGLLVACGLLPGAARADTWTSTGPDVPTVDGATIAIPIDVDGNFTVSDVNVLVTSEHTSGAQLQGTLRHPDGTSVSLFDMPAGTGLLFTCFDDEAAGELAGSAPFTGTFQAEGDLSLFDDKPSLGLWHLDVHDRTGGGTGVVRGVSLAFNGRTYVAPGGPLPILDFTEVPMPVSVAEDFLVGDVDVVFAFDHDFHGDLIPRLSAPGGTKDRLLKNLLTPGADPGNAGPMVLDDESPEPFPLELPPHHGRYKGGHPYELGLWTGIGSAGMWVLSLEDFQWGDEGNFQAWALHLTEGPLCDSASWSVNLTGVAGTSGFAPVLDLAGPPLQGSTVDLELGNSAGVLAAALLLVGLEPAEVQGLGGTVWVAPLFELALALPPGGLVIPTTFAIDPALCGLPILAQLLHADDAAPKGVAFSPRLQVLPGDC